MCGTLCGTLCGARLGREIRNAGDEYSSSLPPPQMPPVTVLNILNRHARATLLGEMMFIARSKTLDRDVCCHARVSDHVAISTCGDSRLRAFGVSRTITAQEMDRWHPNILYIYTRSRSYSCFISISSNLSFEWPSISRDNIDNELITTEF